MNVLLCTKYDLAGSMLLNLILPRIAGEHSVKMLLANRVRPETASIPELRWMKLFEQDLPARLLFPLIDRRATVSPKLAADDHWLSFGELAQQYNVPMTNAGHIANPTLLTQLVQEAAPDLIVSFQFGFIFKPEALAVPRLGGLNLHSGSLPLRAGINPTFWCMKEGDSHAACTLHWMDHGIDSGNLVEVRPMALDYSRSFFANWMANYSNGAQMIVDAILTLGRSGELPSIVQDAAQRRYVATPTRKDFAAFFAAGCRLIDPDDFLDLMARYLPNN